MEETFGAAPKMIVNENQVWGLNYDSHDDIRNAGLYLDNAISIIQNLTGNPNTKVFAIGHSMGSIVIREYLQNVTTGFIKKSLFLGAPNVGSRWAESFPDVTFISKKQLCEDSLYLQELNDFTTKPFVSDTVIWNAYNTDIELLGPGGGLGDGIVNAEQAKLEVNSSLVTIKNIEMTGYSHVKLSIFGLGWIKGIVNIPGQDYESYYPWIIIKEFLESPVNQIIFSSNRSGNFDIWKINADGTGLTQLTESPFDDTTPFWSPDGSQIAYIRKDDWGNNHIRLMNSDGNNDRDLSSISHSALAGWSPYTNKVLFNWLKNSDTCVKEIYEFDDVTFSNPIYFLRAQIPGNKTISSISFSEDHKLIVWAEQLGCQDSTTEILMSEIIDGAVDLNKVQRITMNNYMDNYPAISNINKEIVYVHYNYNYSNLLKYNYRDNVYSQLTDNIDYIYRNVDFSSDGKMLVFQSNKDGNWDIWISDANADNQINLTSDSYIDLSPDFN